MTALLLAEPEPAVRGFLERQLVSDGFDVLSFARPEELPRATEPDLLLLGDPAALERCVVPDCPVIVLGNADPAVRVRALARCDDYLTRPFLYEELVARIHAVLRRRPPRRELIELDELVIDRTARRVLVRGREVGLAAKEYALLGRSGLRVSELCLGTMTFGDDWGWGADRAASRRVFEEFARRGGNFVDTANNYTNGTSEELVGELVERDRDRFVVATKYSLTIAPDDPNAGGNHRKSLVRSLEQSLRRLRTGYVDVLWLHMRDAFTPIEDAVRALDDQVRLGKVLHVGISDSPAWLAAQATTLADLRGWSPFVALQVPYSVAGREPERELLPMAAACGLAVTPWGVLEAGALTGKPKEERRWPEDGDLSPRTERVVDALRRTADKHGATPAQVAIAWLLHREEPPTIVPIVGARTAEQLAENLDAVDLRLDPDQLAELDEAGRPELGFPRSFLESEHVRRLIHGTTFAQTVA